MKEEFRIEFMNGSRIEQIERASFYLFSIFSALDADPISDEHPLASNVIADFSHIGTAFTRTIYENISHFIEPSESQRNDEIEGLASSLSEILNNPEMPVNLYDALKNAITEAFDKDLNRFEPSPEFLKTVIKVCQKNES